MAGLVPAIHAAKLIPFRRIRLRMCGFPLAKRQLDGVDGRDKPGHDESLVSAAGIIGLRVEGNAAQGATTFTNLAMAAGRIGPSPSSPGECGAFGRRFAAAPLRCGRCARTNAPHSP
jgi:hypothetical protein